MMIPKPRRICRFPSDRRWLIQRFSAWDEMVVAVGNGSIRARIQEIFGQKGVKMAVLVHPNSTIGAHVTLGDGTVVMAER